MGSLIEARDRLALFQRLFEHQDGIEDLHRGLTLLSALSTEENRQIGANLVLTYSKWVAERVEGLLSAGVVHHDGWLQYLGAVTDECRRCVFPLAQQFQHVWVKVAEQYLEELSPAQRQRALSKLRRVP